MGGGWQGSSRRSSRVFAIASTSSSSHIFPITCAHRRTSIADPPVIGVSDQRLAENRARVSSSSVDVKTTPSHTHTHASRKAPVRRQEGGRTFQWGSSPQGSRTSMPAPIPTPTMPRQHQANSALGEFV
eukprot:1556336-Rhodomonas_salina.2